MVARLVCALRHKLYDAVYRVINAGDRNVPFKPFVADASNCWRYHYYLIVVGLAVQLLIWPDSVQDDEARPERPQGPALPKVTVTSSPDEIRRAFDSLSSTDESTGAR